ncbi:MAG TPA: hypothetical protein V6D30_20530, partial [Leptolyngbyaceae cyanobacterium]
YAFQHCLPEVDYAKVSLSSHISLPEFFRIHLLSLRFRSVKGLSYSLEYWLTSDTSTVSEHKQPNPSLEAHLELGDRFLEMTVS